MKFFILLVLALGIVAVAEATNINSCQTLVTPGAYDLINDVSINGSTCITINASNVTLNCQGFKINASTGIGIYSNQINTIIKNCIINGTGKSIFFENVTGGVINNVNTSLNGAANVIQILNSNTLINDSELSAGGDHEYPPVPSITFNSPVYISESNLTINNSIFVEPDEQLLYAYNSSLKLYNTQLKSMATQFGSVDIENNTFLPIGVGYGISVSGFSNLFPNATQNGFRFVGNNMNDTFSNLRLHDVHNGIIANNTLTCIGIDCFAAISFASFINSSDLILYNNTIISDTWVSVFNVSNIVNVSFNTTTMGNTYYLANSTPSWTIGNGTTWTCTSNCPWADGGVLPLNSTTFANNWIGIGGDYHPFMGITTFPSVQVSIRPLLPTIFDNLRCSAIAGSQFSIYNASIEWYKNSTNQTSLASTYLNLPANVNTTISTIDNSNLAVGNVWYCRVRINNAGSFSNWTNSQTVQVVGQQDPETKIAQLMLSIVGDPFFLGIIVFIFFAAFLMMQGARMDTFLVILIPAAFLSLVFMPSFLLIFALLIIGVLVMLALKRIFG